MAFIGEFKNDATGMVIADAYYRITLIEYMPKSYLAARVSIYLNKEARFNSKACIAPKNYRIDGDDLAKIEGEGRGRFIDGMYNYLGEQPEFKGLERA